MFGVNIVVIGGHVSSFQFGVTNNREEEVCTFTLAIEDPKRYMTWAKVNVFGGTVVSCRRFLRTGSWVVVMGEIMNRKSRAKDDMVTEIRCKDIRFVKGADEYRELIDKMTKEHTDGQGFQGEVE